MIELAEIGTRLGTHWLLAWEYAEAFRAKKEGTITAGRLLRVFKELAVLLEKCVFEYDGKRYRTNPAGIKTALQTVCDAQKYGFKNHNYLKKVLLESSERLSTEGLTAKEERAMDEGRGAKEEETGEWPESVDEIKQRLGVNKMSDLIGGKYKK